MTLLALVLAGLFLIPLGVAADIVIRGTVANAIWRETREAASRVAVAYRDAELRNPIAPGPDDVTVIQVVGPGHHILASTAEGQKLPPLSDLRPVMPHDFVDFTTCQNFSTDCFHVTATLAGAAPGSPVVYAAAHTPAVLSTRVLDVAVGLQIAALACLVGWTTWKSADRNLRIIDHIQAQLAHITASDLSRRVREPPGDDEIATLARTVNSTLARLEHSVEQQRRFAADASHELRTPIAGLRAQLEEAMLHPEETDVGTLVPGALRDTDRLETIVTDLLFMARLGSGGPAAQESVDLGQLAAEEIARRPARTPIIADLQEDVTVLGVRTHLFRVIGNLLDNAQRHAASTVRVEVYASRGSAALTVTNDGDRIAEQDRERVFHRFTRLDTSRSRDKGGTGLGLAIARDVAIAHGGTLHVEDVPEGTRFVLRLSLIE
ncbi:sensor histidine kinase [Sphaerisporangium perillae]|uniref:sensor histidine kinase n=1 Tax=Sphaerisporangium perillae TaxID=2935860 RepID=UPI00200FCEFA|nr:HAMP domain-containing sensor histidine kinase [Sphaerisporangium perillae]